MLNLSESTETFTRYITLPPDLDRANSNVQRLTSGIDSGPDVAGIGRVYQARRETGRDRMHVPVQPEPDGMYRRDTLLAYLITFWKIRSL